MKTQTFRPVRLSALCAIYALLLGCAQEGISLISGPDEALPNVDSSKVSIVRTSCVPHSYPQRTNQSLAVDPRNHDVVYVGVEGEGFYKSVNGGASWQRIVDGIKVFWRIDEDRGCYSEFFTTVVDPANSQRICFTMAGSPGTPDVMAAANQGIYCSRNGGSEWQQRVQHDMNTAIYALAIDPGNPDVMYAGSNANSASFVGADTTKLYNTIGVIHKSVNGGATWTELPTGMVKGTRVTAIRIDPSRPQVVYASTFGLRGGGGSNYLETQYGVLKSTDAGATWRSMKVGLGPGLVNEALFRMDLSPNAPHRLIVTAGNQSYFLSEDGGNSFVRPRQVTSQAGIARFDPHDPTGQRILGFSERGTNLMESKDGGHSWNPIGPLPEETLNNGDPAKPTGVRPSQLVISASDPRVLYLSGSHARVYRSNDRGSTWTRVLGTETLPR